MTEEEQFAPFTAEEQKLIEFYSLSDAAFSCAWKVLSPLVATAPDAVSQAVLDALNGAHHRSQIVRLDKAMLTPEQTAHIKQEIAEFHANPGPIMPTPGYPGPHTIREWQTTIHEYAKSKGWYDNDIRTFGDMCSLFTSEVSEAYEEYRNGHEVTETYYKDEHGETFPQREDGTSPPGMKPEGVPTELADVVIRILDYCERVGIDLQAIMVEKHAYNETRSYRHGGKRT